jgi:hypothetical protein
MRRKILPLILLLLAAASAAIAAPQSPAAVPVPVELISAEFGTFDASNPDEMVFEPTRLIPHRQGQRYGWAIALRTKLRSVSVSEEYLLPNAASTRPSPENSELVMDIPQARRNQVSQRQLVPVEGMIYGEWVIGPNEPAGRRHLQVVIEGQEAARFQFEVK